MKSSQRLALLPAETTTMPLDPASPHHDTELGFFTRGIEEETNPSAEIHPSDFAPPTHRLPRLLITAGVVLLLTGIWIVAR